MGDNFTHFFYSSSIILSIQFTEYFTINNQRNYITKSIIKKNSPTTKIIWKIEEFQFLFGFIIVMTTFEKWSRRGSNPRPNKESASFLHVYFLIDFRLWDGQEHPNPQLML